jgi:hypothetical protein
MHILELGKRWSYPIASEAAIVLYLVVEILLLPDC